METRKIVNWLNGSDNENSKFATKKWFVIESETTGAYSENEPINFLTRSIEWSLCDYSDAYILVTGNITATPNNDATQVVFKNCAQFKTCRTEINEIFVDKANFINIAKPLYNLIEYSNNYSDTSGSLWGFRRDEIVNNADVSNDDDYNVPLFKYKASPIGITEDNGTKGVSLKYLSNLWKSLEMPLINCRVELSLTLIERCMLTVANTATFKITDAKLSKLLSEGFKTSAYWNKYKLLDNIELQIAAQNEEKHIRELLDSNCPGVKILFVLAYNNTANNNQVSVDSYKNYFLSRVKIDIFNIEIDDSIKQFDEIRKISKGQGDDCTTVVYLILLILKRITD